MEETVGDIDEKVTPSQDDSATAEKSTEQPSQQAPDIDAVIARLAKAEETVTRLQERFATVSPEAIVDSVVKHPRFEQQHRDMTNARVNARAQELVDILTEPIEELAAAGVDAEKVSLLRKKAKTKAREMAEQEIRPKETETPAPKEEDYGAEALRIFESLGLGWGDFPEWKPGQQVSIQEIRQVAPKRAAEKAVAKVLEDEKKKWMKDYEDQAKKAKGDLGVVNPPPAGSPPNDNPIKDITDRSELYRLARIKLIKGEGK